LRRFGSDTDTLSALTDVHSQDPALSDTYLLALLIYQLYNPDRPLPNLSAAPQLSTIGSVPKPLFPVYKRMLNPNAKTRLATTRFVSEVEPTGYWQGNNLIELVNSLEGFELAGEADKISLLRRIRESQEILPPPFLISKILPSLLHSLSLPSAPASHILPLVLSIGKNVPPHRYTATVLDPVVRLYASPDRGDEDGPPRRLGRIRGEVGKGNGGRQGLAASDNRVCGHGGRHP
jgi:SCY1-like protein 1